MVWSLEEPGKAFSRDFPVFILRALGGCAEGLPQRARAHLGKLGPFPSCHSQALLGSKGCFLLSWHSWSHMQWSLIGVTFIIFSSTVPRLFLSQKSYASVPASLASWSPSISVSFVVRGSFGVSSPSLTSALTGEGSLHFFVGGTET